MSYVSRAYVGSCLFQQLLKHQSLQCQWIYTIGLVSYVQSEQIISLTMRRSVILAILAGYLIAELCNMIE